MTQLARSSRLRRRLRRFGRWLPNPLLLGVLVASYAALMAASSGSWIIAAATCILAVVLGRRLLVQNTSHLIGPLFYYELIRLGRRPRTIWVRCGHGVVLLLALWVIVGQFPRDQFSAQPTFSAGARHDPNALARQAERFSVILLFLQGAVVLVLPTLYLSGAIVEERTRRTLDFLLASHLTDTEILVGKLCARLVAAGAVLLMALPVLALTQLWGGVSIYLLAGGFACLLLTLVQVGSLSLLCSALCRTQLQAIILTAGVYYLVNIAFGWAPLGYTCCPFSFLFELDQRLRGNTSFPCLFDLIASRPSSDNQAVITFQMVCNYAFVTVVFAAFYLHNAARLVRHWTPAPPLLPEPVMQQPAWQHMPRAVAVAVQPPLLGQVRDHPLWWRETRRSPSLAPEWLSVFHICWWVCFVPYVLMLLLIFPAWAFSSPGANRHVPEFLVTLRIVTLITAGAACSFIGLATSLSVSRERAQQTLDALLMLPDAWWKVLAVKWLAPLWQFRWIGLFLLATWIFNCIFPVLHAVAVLLLILAVAAHAAYCASLGLWLSVLCRSTMRSLVVYGSILLGPVVAPWLLPENASVVRIAVCPPLTWWTLCFSWGTPDEGGPVAIELLAACFGVAGYALAAAGLWLLACWRLYNEPNRGGG
jgi:ABC-type transport system involved in multi-copper enzyme maturation permease subunit